MGNLSGIAMAAALGISPAAVSKAKKNGMPMDSLEAAQRWRRENLVYAMRKDVNRARTGTSFSGQVVRIEQLIERVRVLMELGEGALATDTFEALREPIREAMRAVPKAHRGEVPVSIAVMDELIEPQLGPRAAAVNGGREPVSVAEADAAGATSQTGNADDADGFEWGGNFLYAMACGEAFQL